MKPNLAQAHTPLRYIHTPIPAHFSHMSLCEIAQEVFGFSATAVFVEIYSKIFATRASNIKGICREHKIPAVY